MDLGGFAPISCQLPPPKVKDHLANPDWIAEKTGAAVTPVDSKRPFQSLQLALQLPTSLLSSQHLVTQKARLALVPRGFGLE